MNPPSVLDKLKSDLVPSLVSGAVSLAAYQFLLGHSLSDQMVVGGTLLPAWAVVGGLTVTSQLVGDVLQDYVLPMIPNNASYSGYEGAVIKSALAGLSYWGLAYVTTNGATFYAHKIYPDKGMVILL